MRSLKKLRNGKILERYLEIYFYQKIIEIIKQFEIKI